MTSIKKKTVRSQKKRAQGNAQLDIPAYLDRASYAQAQDDIPFLALLTFCQWLEVAGCWKMLNSSLPVQRHEEGLHRHFDQEGKPNHLE